MFLNKLLLYCIPRLFALIQIYQLHKSLESVQKFISVKTCVIENSTQLIFIAIQFDGCLWCTFLLNGIFEKTLIIKIHVFIFLFLCVVLIITALYTESFKCFEMKHLWVFSDSPRDKNFRVFPYK